MAKGNDQPSGDMSDVGFSLEDLLDIRGAAEEHAREMILAGTTHGLTEEALRLVYVVLHPACGNSPRRWAEIAGVGHVTYYRWRDRSEWKAAVEQLRDARKSDILTKADRVIEKLLSNPDPAIQLKAARTIYEKAGEFITRVETTHITETPEQRMAKQRTQDRLRKHQEGQQSGQVQH